jgi:hypothetical protein
VAVNDPIGVRSDRCGLEELFQTYEIGQAVREQLSLGPAWPLRWTGTSSLACSTMPSALSLLLGIPAVCDSELQDAPTLGA